MSGWVSKYVGLRRVELGRDWDGVDCYGLVRLVLAHECGLTLPSFAGAYACGAERSELARLIAGDAQAGPWVQVDAIEPFDVLLFRMAGHVSHIGVAIDARRMLHAHCDQSKVARISDPMWASRRAGILRHRGMMP